MRNNDAAPVPFRILKLGLVQGMRLSLLMVATLQMLGPGVHGNHRATEETVIRASLRHVARIHFRRLLGRLGDSRMAPARNMFYPRFSSRNAYVADGTAYYGCGLRGQPSVPFTIDMDFLVCGWVRGRAYITERPSMLKGAVWCRAAPGEDVSRADAIQVSHGAEVERVRGELRSSVRC